MCKLGQLDAVLFAQQALVVAALADIVDLNSLVAGRCHEQLAVVVVVDGEDARLRPAIFDVVSAQQLLGGESVWNPIDGA
jgi:hypothetical protein